MAKARISLEAGMFLSDGETLVQVLSVGQRRIRVETMNDDVDGKSEKTSLSPADVDARWWVVKPAHSDEVVSEEVDEWVRHHYPFLSRGELSLREMRMRERCGCSRCMPDGKTV